MRKDILRSYPNLDPEKVEVIYNGIDSQKWAPTQNQAVLDRYGIDKARRTVMFVGRITRQKGLSYFLQAARDLPEDVQLILAAGAPDTKEIKTEVEALVSKLSANRSGVTWIPEHLPQKELAALLTQTDLFVCPSIY
jgi:starch synthase